MKSEFSDDFKVQNQHPHKIKIFACTSMGDMFGGVKNGLGFSGDRYDVRTE